MFYVLKAESTSTLFFTALPRVPASDVSRQSVGVCVCRAKIGARYSKNLLCVCVCVSDVSTLCPSRSFSSGLHVTKLSAAAAADVCCFDSVQCFNRGEYLTPLS